MAKKVLKDIKDIKFITIGEVLLRLSPPNFEKIRMANSYTINYGGAEANVAAGLSNMGVDSTLFTVVPNNSVGKSAVRFLLTMYICRRLYMPESVLEYIILRRAMRFVPPR